MSGSLNLDKLGEVLGRILMGSSGLGKIERLREHFPSRNLVILFTFLRILAGLGLHIILINQEFNTDRRLGGGCD